MKLFHLLIVVIFAFCAQYTAAQVVTSNKTFGNEITYSEIIDQFTVINPETGEESVVYRKREMPGTINGEPILYDNNASEPVGAASQSTWQDYLRTNLLLEELDRYRGIIHNIDIVIDTKGNVGYIRLFLNTSKEYDATTLNSDIEKKLRSKTFIPAKKNGKAVAYGTTIQGL
jgi:hypothetical protein